MNKILVTGASGFIGSNLAIALAKSGDLIYGSVHEHLLPIDLLSAGVIPIQIDLTTRLGCFTACSGMDVAYMCAAITSGASVIVNNPIAHVTENIVMNTRFLEAAWQMGVKKVVYISSSTIYPYTGRRPTEETEAFVGEPHPSYMWVGWMKRYSEILCRSYAEAKKLEVCVVRPSNAYGPRDQFDPQLSHLVPALIRKAVQRQEPFEVWGTGEDVRDLIYVDDLIEGIIAAEKHTGNYLAINIASGQGYSVKEVAETILRLTEHNVPIQFAPDKPTTIPIRLVSTQKVRDLFGFSAKTTLENGLELTIEWYRSHQK